MARTQTEWLPYAPGRMHYFGLKAQNFQISYIMWWFQYYVTFYQINKFFVNTLTFHYWQNIFAAGWKWLHGL